MNSGKSGWKLAIGVMAALAGLARMSVASGAVVDIPAVQNATIFGGSETTDSESQPGIFAGTDGMSNVKRGLIEFNIRSYVPSGSVITGVQLNLDLGQVAGTGGGGSGSGSETISLFDETQTWGQSTNIANRSNFSGTGGGAAANNGDATWNDALYNSTPASATAWETEAGGNWTDTSTDIADASVGATLEVYSWSDSAMVTDVQNWLNNSSSNFGWLMKNSDESTLTDFRAFWSAQGAAAYLAANPSNPGSVSAPQLVVTYVPEPGMGMLAGAGVMMVLARRGRRSGAAMG